MEQLRKEALHKGMKKAFQTRPFTYRQSRLAAAVLPWECVRKLKRVGKVESFKKKNSAALLHAIGWLIAPLAERAYRAYIV